MGETAVKRCNCKHEFQDKTYGKGVRLHNKRDKANSWKCTVCGNDKKES